MADSKMFITNGIEIEKIGVAIQGFLREKKGLHAEGMKTPQGYLVQAKEEEGWKKFTGMDTSIQIQMFPAGDNQVMINVGQGAWIDKAGAATVGAIAFAPLAVTAGIGAWMQKKLPGEIFDFVERFILSGGKSVTVSMAASLDKQDGQVLCPSCSAANPEGAKFCTVCGSKLGKECPSCVGAIGLDTKFCPNCGANVQEEERKSSIKNYPQCSNECAVSAKFCTECGHKFEA